VANVSTTRVKSVLSILVLAAAATLGSAGPARAAVYTGTWDPAYGGPFPELGWKASALFDVPDACLASGDGTFAPPSGPCAGVDLLSAQVSFWNIANKDIILETNPLDPDVDVTGVSITDGKLTGINTGFFDHFVSDLDIAGDGKYGFNLLLFGGNRAQLVYTTPPGVRLPGCAFLEDSGVGCGRSANDAIGVFAPIPEPETYALMIAGLGALGFVARRRRRA
jgi:hypothetical protein